MKVFIGWYTHQACFVGGGLHNPSRADPSRRHIWWLFDFYVNRPNCRQTATGATRFWWKATRTHIHHERGWSFLYCPGPKTVLAKKITNEIDFSRLMKMQDKHPFVWSNYKSGQHPTTVAKQAKTVLAHVSGACLWGGCMFSEGEWSKWKYFMTLSDLLYQMYWTH